MLTVSRFFSSVFLSTSSDHINHGLLSDANKGLRGGVGAAVHTRYRHLLIEKSTDARSLGAPAFTITMNVPACVWNPQDTESLRQIQRWPRSAQWSQRAESPSVSLLQLYDPVVYFRSEKGFVVESSRPRRRHRVLYARGVYLQHRGSSCYVISIFACSHSIISEMAPRTNCHT